MEGQPLSKKPRLALPTMAPPSATTSIPVLGTPLPSVSEHQMPLPPAWDPSSRLDDETPTDDWPSMEDYMLGMHDQLFVK
jgi:hypothetical protein